MRHEGWGKPFVDHGEPPVGCAGPSSLARTMRGDAPSAEKAAVILTQMEECLAGLDLLGWTLPAAHLCRAVDSVRDMAATARLQLDTADRFVG